MKKIVIVLTMMVALVMGSIGLTPSPASAHRNTVAGTAVCNKTTGLWDGKWKVTNSETDKSETLYASSRSSVPVGTTIAAGGFKEFTETFTANPAGTALSVKGRWTNGVTADNTGYMSAPSGTCVKDNIKDAYASVSTTPPTCDTGEKLKYGEIRNATWSGSPNGKVGPATYEVNAGASRGHAFADGSTVQSFTGTLSGPDLSLCAPPPCDDVCALPVAANSQGNAVCDGNNLRGTYDNIRVAAGSTCSLTDVYVNGSIKADHARNLLLFDVTVRGNVIANHVSGDVYFGSAHTCKYDPKVGGSIKVLNSHNVLLCNTQVCDDVVVKRNNGKITLSDVTAKRVFIIGNRRFVADGGDTHARLSNIRLIHVNADVTAKGNAPRKVVSR